MRLAAPALGLLGLLCVACGGGDEGSATGSGPDAGAAAREAAAEAAPRRRERPLPAFEGVTLDGEAVSASSYVGRRLIVVLFDPDTRDGALAAEAAAAIAGERGRHNFRILGVATGSAPVKARELVSELGLDFPVLDDTGATIQRRLGLRGPALVLGVDAEGYITFGRTRVPVGAPDPAGVLEADLREALRLPGGKSPVEPVLGERPEAPDFTAPRLDGGEPFRLSELRGRPVALIFFLHTCPHCHRALEALREHLAEIPEAERPRLVGVSIQNRPSAVRERLERDDLDFFPVIFDPDGSVQNTYAAVMGVPVLFLIDADGRIAWRTDGWRDERDPPLLRMRLAALAGQTPPMLLHPTGYSGNEFCVTCHEAQHETWLLTDHARAFDTLVRHGAERDPECVGCHVVGYGEAGGYSLAEPAPHLEDVGCETCHGRGGPHLSPGFVKDGSYAPVCKDCHDPKHSLGFDYAKFVPRVSHAANAERASLSLEEKREILRRRRAPREDLLPQSAEIVGSEACASCHPAEHETWSESRHAKALASLEGQGQDSNAECLMCHTTGYGRDGGFPAGADPAAHPGLANVGCESCHGPGGDHVPEEAPKTGNIVSLGDKCGSCVILQVCGGCHDQANDPGFEFEVQERIEAQRHGTIEPSVERSDTGATGARLPSGSERAAQVGLLQRALDAPGGSG